MTFSLVKFQRVVTLATIAFTATTFSAHLTGSRDLAAFAGNGNGNGGNGNGNSGNGNGNGGGNGNANVSTRSVSTSVSVNQQKPVAASKAVKSKTAVPKLKKDSVTIKSVSLSKTIETPKIKIAKLPSRLGALNAAHASPMAFAHASANSRVGKIRTYYLANAASKTAAANLETAQAAAITSSAANVTAQAAVTTAQLALDAANAAVLVDPTLTQAVIDAQAALDVATAAALISQAAADTAAELVATAQLDADTAMATATAALNLAANKTPVDAETKAALDALLVGKIASQ